MGIWIPVPRVGLVLGAGGLTGMAQHAGALAALELDLGWDPRTADLIVGTSAGSLTGALLRIGVSSTDLAAWCTGIPVVDALHDPLLAAIRGAESALPAFGPRALLRPWRTPGMALWKRLATERSQVQWISALSTLLPAGAVDLDACRLVLGEVVGDVWPDGLWICATRRDDGCNTVFGHPDAPPATLSDAVAASCAIPSYFAPVLVNGVNYIDGGCRSSTNADLLGDEGLDVVVVMAPLSTSGRTPVGWDGPLRRWVHRRLGAEVSALRARGTEVVTIEPGSSTRRAMGLNPMNAARADKIMRASFFETGAYAADPEVRQALAAVDRKVVDAA
jgi:NTE family protein